MLIQFANAKQQQINNWFFRRGAYQRQPIAYNYKIWLRQFAIRYLQKGFQQGP